MKKDRKHEWWYGIWEFYHWDKHRNLIWQNSVENALIDEGEYLSIDTFLRDAALTEFYLGAANDTVLETDALTDLLGEPSGNGYGRQLIERSNVGWPTIVLDDGDFMGTSKLVTFGPATPEAIGPVTLMFLTNVETGTAGKFIAWAPLSATRTILVDETLGCKMKIKHK